MAPHSTQPTSQAPQRHEPDRALQQARRAMAIAGAAVIGLLLANLSVFATFLLFNFILHWGA